MFTFVRQMFRGFVLAAVCLILVPVTVLSCVLGGFIFLPLPATLPEPKALNASRPSIVYDINGREIATLRRYDTNIPVAQSDIPQVLKNAIVAQEDHNFYKHRGVDPRGMLRALLADLRNESVVQGGSTITQQYVKKAYVGEERTIVRKVREAIVAGQLDRQIDKDEILYRYLSTIYLGDGCYGVGAASDSYFRKPVSQLTISEAATLVAVIPAPSAWAPRANTASAENRRKIVLDSMFQQGYIDAHQHEEALAQQLWIEGTPKPDGPVTTIYAPRAAHEEFPYFMSYLKQYLTNKYGADRLYTGGLRIQSTIDTSLQQKAEASIADTLKGTSTPLEMSLVSVEPQTGFVKALVGGRDFSQQQVNLALGACPAVPKNAKGQPMKVLVEPSCTKEKIATGGGTGRQPGSSFKPFVLAAAYEVGIKPTTVYPAPSAWSAPGCNRADCVVHNYEGEVFGSTDLKMATAHSINTVYAPLIRDIGKKQDGKIQTGFVHTAELAKRLGITTASYVPEFHGDSGQYALGSIEVAPLDMAAAYSVFANRGLREPATPVVKVVDVNNQVLEDNTNRKAERVLQEAVADNVTDALRAVVTSGTGRTALNVGRPVAGKTGTSENYSNAWFVGYTPTLSTAVWMGNSDKPSTIRYKGNSRIAGGTVPTQAWTNYMKGAMDGVPVSEFSQPAALGPAIRDVLSDSGATTTVPPLAPQTQRQPKGTPKGDYNAADNGARPIVPPTTPPPAVGGLQPLGQLRDDGDGFEDSD